MIERDQIEIYLVFVFLVDTQIVFGILYSENEVEK